MDDCPIAIKTNLLMKVKRRPYLRPDMRRLFSWICFAVLTFSIQAQPLGSPIRHAPVLTGGFGELRPDHFHAGVDLRSKTGRIGDPVLAAGDGYISRVLIQRDGYGRAAYVQHPDGRTTVYAHLSGFMANLNRNIDTIRYTTRQEEIDLVFAPGKYPVKKGQIIGYMGQTGRANGVHLHYEVRDRSGFAALDPLRNGLQVKDQIPPSFTGLKLYALDDKLLPLFESEANPVNRGATYRVKGDTLLIGAWRVGLGISVEDKVAENRFRTGIQGMQIHIDNDLVYSFAIDQLDFHLNRYINAHLDYGEWVRTGRRFHRCYQIPGNRLPFYPEMKKAGLITLSQKKARKVVVTILDAAGNKRSLLFWIKRSPEMKDPPPRLFQYRIPFGESFKHTDKDITFTIPAGGLYETTFFQFSRQETEAGEVLFQIHHPETPLHQFMNVGLTLSDGALSSNSKWIGVYQMGDQYFSCGGNIVGNNLVFKSRQFGTYQLMVDSVAPLITPLQSTLSRAVGTWSFRIRDNVQAADHIRNLHWMIFIDDQWVPGEWSNQDEKLTISPGKTLVSTAKKLRLSVRDDRGNVTVWEDVFVD